MAVTYDATNIYVDDDAGSASGLGYLFSEILAGVTAAEALRVDSGTGFPTYRFLKHIVLGSTAAGATTNASHIIDTNCVVTFDLNKRFTTRATTTTNVGFTFGTKVGSGTTATGKDGVDVYTASSGTTVTTYRGLVKFYGCKFNNRFVSFTHGFNVLPASTGNGSEIVNCIIDGFTSHVLGQAAAFLDNMYNVDVTSPATVSVVTSQFVTTLDRCTFGTTTAARFTTSNSLGLVYKDCAFFGAPSGAHFQSAAAQSNWVIVRPVWISGIAKFTGLGPASPDLGTQEYWQADVKVVDSVGAGIASIPVKLTDVLGNVHINTTTDANGEITFGSGITTKMVVVADYYQVSSVSTIRHRSPFTMQVNTGSGANTNYLSRTYKFNWPGKETVTTTGGTFEDVNDVVALQDQSGQPTQWRECSL